MKTEEDKEDVKVEDLTNLFPRVTDMYERFQELKANDPYLDKRRLFLENFNRRSWKRSNKPGDKRMDPNFGQFKFKCVAAINTFINVLTERREPVKIIPKYPITPGENMKTPSDKVSSAFNKFFIAPWENRFMDEVMASFDMVMYGKAIEFWPTKGCVRSKNIAVENVFPATNATMNTEDWPYVFVRIPYTVAELYEILNQEEEEIETVLTDFNKEYLKEILDHQESYAASKTDSDVNNQTQGTYSTARDHLFNIVYLFVKNSFSSKENCISVYAFPEEMKDYEKDGQSVTPQIKLLLKEKGYCDCISQVLAVRAYQITRNYWTFNSFAQEIYMATTLYDKSTSLAIRAIKRASILYWKSANPDTQKKMLNQTDDEVQVVDPESELIQTGQHTNNIRDIIEMMRQVMIDTENGQSIGQSSGAQNVKGYPVTAGEAQLREQNRSSSENLNIKVLMAMDVKLYKEVFRRAMDGSSEEMKKSFKCFKDEMEAYSIDKSYYDPEDVYFQPAYMNGGSAYSRVANAQGVFDALSSSPANPGQEQAQKDLVAALVGIHNVDSYISDKMEVDPSIIKAGKENELLDNPNCNPSNVPVLPDDKHLQEIPVHVADYEQKLKIAGALIQRAQQNPNRVAQLIMVMSAQEIIEAQDIKGGHIMAHFQAAATSKENINALKQVDAKYKQLQQIQDQMAAQAIQLTESLGEQMKTSNIADLLFEDKKRNLDLDYEQKKRLNDISTAKAVGTYEAGKEKKAQELQHKEDNHTLDLAAKSAEKELDLTNQQQANEIKQNANKKKAGGDTQESGATTGTN